MNKTSKKTGEQVLRTYGLVVNGSHSDDVKVDLKSSGNIPSGANSNTFATQNYLVVRISSFFLISLLISHFTSHF